VLAAPSPVPSPPATYLVIHIEARRLDLMKEGVGSPIASFPIAVGRKGHETPIGPFEVEEMVVHPDFHRFDTQDPPQVLERVPPGPKNPLGERWIGFAHGEGWTVGMHGTPHPELLGRAVSGGCIRMRNADVIRVYDEVRLGTPVIVRP
jgi:lipoprotein-anchoring transpeptidase ErfK/SrfK